MLVRWEFTIPCVYVTAIGYLRRILAEHQPHQPSATLAFWAAFLSINGDDQAEGASSSSEDRDTRPWAPRCHAPGFVFPQEWFDEQHTHRQQGFAQLCPMMKSLALNIITSTAVSGQFTMRPQGARMFRAFNAGKLAALFSVPSIVIRDFPGRQHWPEENAPRQYDDQARRAASRDENIADLTENGDQVTLVRALHSLARYLNKPEHRGVHLCLSCERVRDIALCGS